MRTPAGAVIVDPSGRANGRGAYVCCDAACIERAVGRGGLGRALEAPIPGDLHDQLRDAAGLGGTTALAPSATRTARTDNQED